MVDYIQNYGFEILVIFVLGIGGYFLRIYGKQIVKNAVNDLIQMAEVNIKGSGLGQDKKDWGIKQLEASEIKVTKAVDKLIDTLVEKMNTDKTSLLNIVAKK